MRPTRSCEVYIDGASHGNPGPAGVGIVFMDCSVRQFSKYVGETTNNVAEYLALIYALQEALQQGYTALTVKTDSELLARQINGVYKVRQAHLRLFHDLALHLAQGFRVFSIAHIPRSQNRLADRLAGQAITRSLAAL
ncbi:MAG: ribonuclease HI family protein [Candidatus Omnitrophica bacterium]|nr:ribonuclease HI family protein [Candidatus Omnitrophota bacterium]MBI3021394.1 ribonuclease HI family protein [Candidatus Omnitrophota bacterium]MBI3082978.1 ribonuclease HI family protein [Candidatus Omnitrophota bacterium]